MPRKKEASFEENLAELEQIVDKLESRNINKNILKLFRG